MYVYGYVYVYVYVYVYDHCFIYGRAVFLSLLGEKVAQQGIVCGRCWQEHLRTERPESPLNRALPGLWVCWSRHSW